ncbi:MAG TPA: hypothetical protein QGH10_01840, partial [Armatimonadota bacterium]|nr:hypothetical protein [Armatimonadota bacterium]
MTTPPTDTDQQNEKPIQRSPGKGMATGMVIGMAAGVAIGLAMDTLAVGIAIGAGIGVPIGTALEQKNNGGESPFIGSKKLIWGL